MAQPVQDQTRSVSRGRDAFESSGRGGAGNIRRSSQSASREPAPIKRGREVGVVHDNQVHSTGRGGAGNIRSPSRDTPSTNPSPALTTDTYEQDVIRRSEDAQRATSHGRGGAGNIARAPSSSQSRERAPVTSSRERGPVSPSREHEHHAFHSTGRGGAGNISSGAGDGERDAMGREEAERRGHAHAEAIHSTGRGGAANITPLANPPVEHHEYAHPPVESTGRGGAGNMIRSPSGSRSRERGGGAGGEHGKGEHGVKGFLHKLGHHDSEAGKT